MITEGISERLQTDLIDELHMECVQQASFAQEKCRLFHGRQQFLNVIKNKIARNKYVLHWGAAIYKGLFTLTKANAKAKSLTDSFE